MTESETKHFQLHPLDICRAYCSRQYKH
ncbi:hypothetical protein B9T30_13930 [Acinetobacter sp. ANC 4973]|nr:hypothetical protein B9T30_13930 [Acinetobacter sp. ANC 4973]